MEYITKIFNKPCHPRQFCSTNEHLGNKRFEMGLLKFRKRYNGRMNQSNSITADLLLRQGMYLIKYVQKLKVHQRFTECVVAHSLRISLASTTVRQSRTKYSLKRSFTKVETYTKYVTYIHPSRNKLSKCRRVAFLSLALHTTLSPTRVWVFL